MLTFKRYTVKKIMGNGIYMRIRPQKNKHSTNGYNLRNVCNDGIRFLVDGERSGGKKSCVQEVVKCFRSTIPFLGGWFGPCSCNSNPSPVYPILVLHHCEPYAIFTL